MLCAHKFYCALNYIRLQNSLKKKKKKEKTVSVSFVFGVGGGEGGGRRREMQGLVWSSPSTSRPSRSRDGWTSLLHLSVVGNSRILWTTSPHAGTTSVSPHALLAVDISPPLLVHCRAPWACGRDRHSPLPPPYKSAGSGF